MSKRDDGEFFRKVSDDLELQTVLRRCGVELWRPSVHEQPHNAVLKFWNPRWLIEMPDGKGVEGVNVHYEARVRNELRVEAEIEPYIPSLAKLPIREAELKRQLAVKADLLAILRRRLLSHEFASELGATERLQRPTDRTSTQCAVKFANHLPVSPDPADAAAYFARIIEKTSPIIDEIVRSIALPQD